jgi:hypothetical protein
MSAPVWLTQLGALGVGGAAGSIGGALVTQWQTRVRERGSWLRELQVEANREFYAAARDIMTYVVTGSAKEPLIDPDAPPGGAPDAIAKRSTELTEKQLAMLPVCEQRTADMATVVAEILPCLAYQAVPLPGTSSLAALDQRKLAIMAMSLLMVDLTGIMRQDVGLSGWRARRQFKKQRQKSQPVYDAMRVSIVDRPQSPSAIGRLLWAWQVQNLPGNTIPEDVSGYYVDQSEIPLRNHPRGYMVQACAIKPPDTCWRFGLVRGLPPNVEFNIVEDIVRLVTGHHNAFKPMHAGQWLPFPGGGRAYLWPAPTT